jgi:hypothetical protein
MASLAPNDPAAAQPTREGRFARWGFAGLLSLIVHLALVFGLTPLMGRPPAHAVARGLSTAVLFHVAEGDGTARGFLSLAAIFLALAAGFEWLVAEAG